MNLIITGSTKGVGRALARRFLQDGDRVLICSRSREHVDTVLAEVAEKYPTQVLGKTVDVTDYHSLEKLAQFTIQQWGSIDMWINNVGTNGYNTNHLKNQEPDMISSIIRTNLLGTLFGCRVAIRHQVPHIFNMDGLGSKGQVSAGYTAYGATKRAIPYITTSLNKELQQEGRPISHIHTLSPGVVITDLLIKDTSPAARRIFNIIAETPEIVADDLVPRIRALEGSSESGKYIKYLSRWKIMWRFLTFWKRKHRFFDAEGQPVRDFEGSTIRSSP